MPKSNDARLRAEKNPHCSFCGQHKDDTPFMVTSTTTGANVCVGCAVSVVAQGFQFMGSVEQKTREVQQRNSELVAYLMQIGQVNEDGSLKQALKLVDSKGNAIDQANSDGG